MILANERPTLLVASPTQPSTFPAAYFVTSEPFLAYSIPFTTLGSIVFPGSGSIYFCAASAPFCIPYSATLAPMTIPFPINSAPLSTAASVIVLCCGCCCPPSLPLPPLPPSPSRFNRLVDSRMSLNSFRLASETRES